MNNVGENPASFKAQKQITFGSIMEDMLGQKQNFFLKGGPFKFFQSSFFH